MSAADIVYEMGDRYNERKRYIVWCRSRTGGDPELMTYKAIKTIEDCEIIAVPNVNREKSVSYRIAAGIIHDIDKKICIDQGTPMTKDKEVLNLAYEKAASRIAGYLAEGKKYCISYTGRSMCVFYIYVYRTKSKITRL